MVVYMWGRPADITVLINNIWTNNIYFIIKIILLVKSIRSWNLAFDKIFYISVTAQYSNAEW